MRGFEKFLFIYGVIITTVIALGSFFFSPRPENFIVLILFFPIVAYFWIRVSSPQDVKSSKWSLRLLFIVFILSALGLFAFSLSKKQEADQKARQEALTQAETLKKLEELKEQLESLSKSSASSEDVASDVARIKEELSSLKAQEEARSSTNINPNLLGAYNSLEDIPIGSVTISDSKIKELDVLKTPSFSASAVGKMDYGKNYDYYQKDSTWYLIKLEDGTKGWVNDRDVKELYPVSPTP
jgi:hypothetical protein